MECPSPSLCILKFLIDPGPLVSSSVLEVRKPRDSAVTSILGAGIIGLYGRGRKRRKRRKRWRKRKREIGEEGGKQVGGKKTGKGEEEPCSIIETQEQSSQQMPQMLLFIFTVPVNINPTGSF